jgi:YhcH/YjgK/YiaL family protein
MIYDHIDNYKRYDGCSKHIEKAFEFIINNKNVEDAIDGAYVLEEDSLIAHIVSASTRKSEDGELEIHKEFIDLHYICQGSEMCEFGDTMTESDVFVYSEEKDIAFLSEEQVKYAFEVGRGQFYIVWPYETHKPLIAPPGSEVKDIKKIIIKIRVL